MTDSQAVKANYDRIAADHIAHWRATGQNPWQPPDQVEAVVSHTAALVEKYSVPGDAILDAGCGMGELLARVHDRQRYGCDWTASYIEIARTNGIDAVEADLEHLPYEDGRFAVVVAADVLEHVVELNAVIREMLRVLRPGGVLIARSPDKEDLSQYLDPNYPYRFVHLRGFDAQSFRLLFERIFDCVTVEVVKPHPLEITIVVRKST